MLNGHHRPFVQPPRIVNYITFIKKNNDLLNRSNHIKEKYYNPTVARLLDPDTVLQYPYGTQPACRNASTGRNYNRYSYVVNNPLKYTDPTGYRMSFQELSYFENQRVQSGGGDYRGYMFGANIDSRQDWAFTNENTDFTFDERKEFYGFKQDYGYNGSMVDFYKKKNEKGYVWVDEVLNDKRYKINKYVNGELYSSMDGFLLVSSKYYFAQAGGGASEPWIPHPRRQSEGIIGKSSLDNLRVRVTEFDKKFDRGVYAKDDPSNKAAISLLKGFSKTFPPTSVLISGSTMATGQDQFTGQNVYGFDRWGTPAIDILFNAPGVPLKLVLFWNLMNNPGVPTPAPPNQ